VYRYIGVEYMLRVIVPLWYWYKQRQIANKV
jgi:hypothetical protein